MTAPLLEVRELGVRVRVRATERILIDGITFAVARGECVGIVGASGAGKSTVASALIRLLPSAATFTPGSGVRLGGEELLALDEREMRSRRGRRLAMIFQEPLLALDPAMPVGEQLAETLLVHGLATAGEARERAIEMIERVGIGGARRAAERYPHEFSGGMRQRLVIAAALLPGPELVIADEPTTALDPTIQAQVLDLLDDLRAASGTSLILISHDLDVVAERCDRVLVMDDGRIVESGPAATIADAPTSEAGARLAMARRRLTAIPREGPNGPPDSLLRVENLSVQYRDRRRRSRGTDVTAVDSVSFSIAPGESVGLVGESGCGKTSIALAILQLVPAGGAVLFGGEDLHLLEGEVLRRQRRRLQMVPQDAGASLTPHLTAGELVTEGFEVHGIASGAEATRRARALFDEMGLPDHAFDALPPALSAGERQRVAIARALSTSPDLLVCDEPVASLDAPTRERLLALLDQLRRDRGLALLFISHDLASVQRITSRLLVMYLGRIVESGPTAAVIDTPRMPYTQALLSAVPTGDRAHRQRRIVLPGEPPSPGAPSSGCAFHPRCPHPSRDSACVTQVPPLRHFGPGHDAACLKA